MTSTLKKLLNLIWNPIFFSSNWKQKSNSTSVHPIVHLTFIIWQIWFVKLIFDNQLIIIILTVNLDIWYFILRIWIKSWKLCYLKKIIAFTKKTDKILYLDFNFQLYFQFSIIKFNFQLSSFNFIQNLCRKSI